MPLKVFAFGPCNIQVNTGTPSGGNTVWENLGYTADGVMIRQEAIELPIPGDENGGQEGAPIDFQHLTEQHFLTCELTKLDEAVLQKINSRFRSGVTAGQTKAPGTLIADQYFSVLLVSDTVTANHRRYRQVYATQPIELKLGTKYSRPLVVLHALPFKDTSVTPPTYTLWDDSLTAPPVPTP